MKQSQPTQGSKSRRGSRPTEDLDCVEFHAEDTEYQDQERAPRRDLDPTELRMRDAQIALIALGYLDINTREVIGERNGSWGRESRQALLAFTRDHDLGRAETLDAITYRAIVAAYDAALEARTGGERRERDAHKPLQ
jgi:hypothetical protein